ncbi:MAG: hypothetical protein R3F17_14210 [Planctomycetota bacterium]
MAETSPSAEPERRGILYAIPRRPVAVTMLFCAVAVFGVVSLAKLPMDLLSRSAFRP